MYHKAYGIIETLAPLHVGASAGEETGNLNLIFRDQFTQTGIIPGSSIRGRFRADLRQESGNHEYWYGAEAVAGEESSTTEGVVKFEYASLLWIPVYCPNQPVVRVSCPALLRRYYRILNQPKELVQPADLEPYSYWGDISGATLFFNLGFLPLKKRASSLKEYMPNTVLDRDTYPLVIVKDTEIAMIHDMALYRQSRVALGTEDDPNMKKAKRGAFFNVEALPEGTVMVFPIALRKMFEGKGVSVQQFLQDTQLDQSKELYFGGLESIGFGRTNVTVTTTKE